MRGGNNFFAVVFLFILLGIAVLFYVYTYFEYHPTTFAQKQKEYLVKLDEKRKTDELKQKEDEEKVNKILEQQETAKQLEAIGSSNPVITENPSQTQDTQQPSTTQTPAINTQSNPESQTAVIQQPQPQTQPMPVAQEPMGQTQPQVQPMVEQPQQQAPVQPVAPVAPSRDPLYFNIILNVPAVISSNTMLDQASFERAMQNASDKKAFCDYSVKVSKIYSATNNGEALYSKNPVRPLNTEEQCMTAFSNADLYQVYVAIYTGFINPDADIPEDIVAKLNKAKRARVKNYFNVAEDFPNFLPRANPMSMDDFRNILTNPVNMRVYCSYYSRFIDVYNALSNAGIPTITVEDCMMDFNFEEHYADYQSFYQYLDPKKFTTDPQQQADMTEIRNYKLPNKN
jgi:hypothetical protein